MAHREFLFRGKRIDNDEWVYGSFCMDAVEQKNGLCGVDGFIRLYDFDKGKMQMHEVDRETVGQFTGLTDKSGQKIFEGDVVRFEDIDGEMVVCVVLWGACGGRWELDVPATGNRFAMSFYDVVVEVIGNIHDNPELLEGLV